MCVLYLIVEGLSTHKLGNAGENFTHDEDGEANRTHSAEAVEDPNNGEKVFVFHALIIPHPQRNASLWT